MADSNNKDILVLNPDYLKKAGIEISNAKDAAAKARAALTIANNGKGYIPQNAGSDMAVQIVDYVRQELNAGESAMKHVCVALASLDMSKEYEHAHDANGNPYTSMLGFAMDIMPNLAKSTVAGYMAVGKNIYVPAIRKRFGKASDILYALPPSTLDAIKSNLGKDDYRNNTIEAIKTASRQGNVTQRLAKSIAKIVRDAVDNKTIGNLTAAQVVKAAKGDAETLKIVYPSKTIETRTGGATANGGNAAAQAAAQESHNNEAYNVVKAKMREYVAMTEVNGNKGVTFTQTQIDGLSGYLKRALTSNDENDARRVVRALLEIITG